MDAFALSSGGWMPSGGLCLFFYPVSETCRHSGVAKSCTTCPDWLKLIPPQSPHSILEGTGPEKKRIRCTNEHPNIKRGGAGEALEKVVQDCANPPSKVFCEFATPNGVVRASWWCYHRPGILVQQCTLVAQAITFQKRSCFQHSSSTP